MDAPALNEVGLLGEDQLRVKRLEEVERQTTLRAWEKSLLDRVSERVFRHKREMLKDHRAQIDEILQRRQ